MVDHYRIFRWVALFAAVCVAAALISPVSAKAPTKAATNKAAPATKPAASAAKDADDSQADSNTDDDTPDAPKPPSDGKKYDLRYKLSTGDVLRYTVTHHAAIRSTIDQSTQAAETKTDSVKVWKVTDVLPNRQIEFMDVIEQVHMVNQLPDRAATEYDSTKDKTPPPGYEDTAKAIGIPLSVVRMTPRGEVVNHKMKYQQGPTEPDTQITVRLPDRPVAIGATWDEPFDINVATAERRHEVDSNPPALQAGRRDEQHRGDRGDVSDSLADGFRSGVEAGAAADEGDGEVRHRQRARDESGI